MSGHTPTFNESPVPSLHDGAHEAEANAAFIVRAVNSHEALVEALEGVIRVADRKTVEFDAARAALALARGEKVKP